MRRFTVLLALGAALSLVTVLPGAAGAVPAEGLGPSDESRANNPPRADQHSQNMHLLASRPQTDFTNSDMAYWGNIAYVGNYGGFRVFDISAPGNPKMLANVSCFGPQNDVSVWEDLLFLSVDAVLTGPECGSPGAANPEDPTGWEGIRIFDVSDPANPQYLTDVYTDCGSHTHTLVPDTENDRVLLYVASYALRPGPDCGPNTGDDPLHNQLSVVEVPLSDPLGASVINEPTLDGQVFDISDIIPILDPTFGCHDIQVFTELGIAAAACLSEGQIWDISDPANPDTANAVHIDNDDIEIWHSAAFTWDGEIVVFGDESLFGSCQDPSQMNGRLWFYDTDDAAAGPLGSFLIPRIQDSYCSSHLFNVLPRNDRYILASSWYGGGTSIIDFTDPANAEEIGYYDAEGTSAWSTYWYNGLVFQNDIPRGFDVFRLSDNSRAKTKKVPYMNPQTQEDLLP